MNKIHILFLAIGLFYSINCNSQISYVEGYYINNSNQKINCLIKDIDWKNNPQKFKYKTTEQAEDKTLTIKTVKEFGINNVSKYIRAVVNIDMSSRKLDQLSNEKDPIFKQEQLFLKVLIEGDASLFLYNYKSLRRYFYQTPNKDINQLVFKEYKSANNKIETNNKFRNQLYTNLKCNDITINDVNDVDYKKEELLNFFTKYNTCKNSEFINFEEKRKSDSFNFTIRPGINSSSLSIRNGAANSRNEDYDNEFNFRLGLELEFIMGFNNNKWALLIEPTYQYYKTNNEVLNYSLNNADYQSIELPIGIRHYVFLNKTSKFFINGSYIYDLAINSKVRGLDAKSNSGNFAFGVGYKYNNKYSVEFRYHTSRDILTDYVTWTSDYKTASIIFGYSIF
ncbi:hypothetical protein SAMN05216503_2131 [Polaribacter sp. KT25b]|uniref:hypothetical protein n=1 Tax=Polaribacter sp. KT25b TaxID=1855336 RepID=UPI00087BB538|nr:hypothetical protein [Polaribacter sp. KT25b]SDS14861.1 hypothetical protein SAMN05216503_2131 [Polaribacter sp. KT25b]